MNEIKLTGSVNLTAAAGGGLPTFSMLANTGGPMRLGGVPTYADLRGMTLKAGTPILLGHDQEKIIGHTTGTRIDAEGLHVSGVISGAGQHVDDLVASAKNGFPWRASIGASVTRTEYVEAKGTAKVNGRTITGPAVIARAGEILEVSFVSIPADPGASATVKASQSGTAGKGCFVDLTFDDYLAASGFCSETLTEQQRVSLEAAFAAKKQADDAKRLEELRASRPNPAPSIRTGKSWSTSADHLAAALMVKSGFGSVAEKRFSPDIMEQSRGLQSRGLMDIAAAGLAADGIDTTGFSKTQIIKAAISTGSFAEALSSSADKVLVASYASVPQTWRSFAATRPVPNFRTQTGIRPTWAGDLEELPDGGNIRHGTYDEETYSWSIKTYAKMYSFGRQQIINDDLQIYTDVLPGLGKAAARSLSDHVYTVLLANGGSFFSVPNGNLISGGSSVLSATSLKTAVLQMRNMRDTDNNNLDLQPAVLLTGPTLETTARALIQSMELARSTATDTMAPTANPFANFARLEIEPRLENSAFTGSSDTQWYLFASPADVPMAVGFLDGQESPTIESFGLDHDIDKLAVGFRVYFDYGAALGDYRAAQKSAGA